MTTCPTCRDLQEERAAIHQFDGGCTRKEAEELAWKVRCQKHDLNNGLFQVTTDYLCAAFALEDGAVKSCAPILRKKLDHWKSVAKKVIPPETLYQPPHGVMGDPSTGAFLSSARMKHGVGKIPVDGFRSFDSL